MAVKIFIMKKIPGLDISLNSQSKRIIDIKIEDEILDKLIFPFNKFNVTTLEYKPLPDLLWQKV